MRIIYIVMIILVVVVAAASFFISPLSGKFIVEPDPLVKKAQFHTSDYNSSSLNVSITWLGV